MSDNDCDVKQKLNSCGRCCCEQPLLRAAIMLVAIAVLSLGGLLFCTGSAGLFNLVPLELLRTAELLKVPANQANDSMLWVYKVLAAIGYATANIGALSICALSGRRQVHTVTGAVTSGGAAGIYIAVMLRAVKPRIAEIIKAMQSNQKRYFWAFELTGDERYVSQIHLHSGCCGLTNGASDFSSWGRNLPSSCCGQLSGKCSTTQAWKNTCRNAVDKLAGSDGLLGLGFIVWILGVTCAALSCLLLVLLLSSSRCVQKQLDQLHTEVEKSLQKDKSVEATKELQSTARDEDLLTKEDQKASPEHGRIFLDKKTKKLGMKSSVDEFDYDFKETPSIWKQILGLGGKKNLESILASKLEREIDQQNGRMQMFEEQRSLLAEATASGAAPSTISPLAAAQEAAARAAALASGAAPSSLSPLAAAQAAAARAAASASSAAPSTLSPLAAAQAAAARAAALASGTAPSAAAPSASGQAAAAKPGRVDGELNKKLESKIKREADIESQRRQKFS